jgi:hypothetical protein
VRVGLVERIEFLGREALATIERGDVETHAVRQKFVTSASSPVPPGRPSLP